jgi:hypothetical protein
MANRDIWPAMTTLSTTLRAVVREPSNNGDGSAAHPPQLQGAVPRWRSHSDSSFPYCSN